MKSNRLVVVGLGRTGRELLRRLSREFETALITLNPEDEEALEELKRADVEVIVGDATSRLVLADARVDEADAVIITTTSERVNTEVARVLKERFNPQRVISVAFTQADTEELEKLGVEVEIVHNAIAMDIRNMIEQKSKAAHAIGIGKEEILEVEIHPNSRFANKPLRFLNPIKWRIGIIYREGNIIVPRHDVVLKPKDKVVILGDPVVLKTVSEIMTFDFQKFPLEYGPRLVACISGHEDESYIKEINYIFSTFPMERAIVICSEKAEGLLAGLEIKNLEVSMTSLSPLGVLMDSILDGTSKHGLVVIPGKTVEAPFFAQGKKRLLCALLADANCPVLLANGTFPYEKMAVPCTVETGMERMVETGLEISSTLGNELWAILVKPSKYIAGEEEAKSYGEMKKSIYSMSSIYRVKLNTCELAGNPIRAVLGEVGKYSLLLADSKAMRRGTPFFSLLSPDVMWNIIRKSPISTLVLPPEEEYL